MNLDQQTGKLSLVATPIGNLEDLTFRAVRTLQSADVIAAEDTRHARKLLQHYEISKPLTAYHMHNEHKQTAKLLERVLHGEHVAMLTDGGTPCISDPGFLLVRSAVEMGIEPEVIPGPSALIHAAVASGLPMHEFLFAGFLPPKGEKRRKRLGDLARRAQTLIFYESPYRMERFLEDIVETIGDNAKLVIVREATKHFEERIRGTAGELKQRYAGTRWKGEITVVVHHSA
ncbi:MAG: 16S rRNA (cytidine(1402)-2'-O)-methyltransferase [Lentisphaerae bacterium]|nr:MAG: 16S rRNA (cytidine(1402)-2'-O)-methyltransferase [Lentisphaerota bacterium]